MESFQLALRHKGWRGEYNSVMINYHSNNCLSNGGYISHTGREGLYRFLSQVAMSNVKVHLYGKQKGGPLIRAAKKVKLWKWEANKLDQDVSRRLEKPRHTLPPVIGPRRCASAFSAALPFATSITEVHLGRLRGWCKRQTHHLPSFRNKWQAQT